MVVDGRDNVERLLEVVRDQDAATGEMRVEVLPLRYASAAGVVADLRECRRLLAEAGSIST